MQTVRLRCPKKKHVLHCSYGTTLKSTATNGHSQPCFITTASLYIVNCLGSRLTVTDAEAGR